MRAGYTHTQAFGNRLPTWGRATIPGSASCRVIAELMMVRCQYLSEVDGEIMTLSAMVSEGAEDNASVVIGQVIEVVAVM